jgi:hypothetical protein
MYERWFANFYNGKHIVTILLEYMPKVALGNVEKESLMGPRIRDEPIPCYMISMRARICLIFIN